jgi:hypothetical protein
MSNLKQLRGQLRQIAKELLPELLTGEFREQMEQLIKARMDQIEADTKKTMHEMNTRHKDTMGYLVRQVTVPSTKKE